MQSATQWRPRPAGSRQTTGAPQSPVVPPAGLTHLGVEWEAISRGRLNVLLEGTSSATDEVLNVLDPYFREPLQEFRPEPGASVPQPIAGTLVLLDVDSLAIAQQTELLSWLDECSGRFDVQIVSTAARPLFPLVESGAYLADLYYRLNVVRIDLTAGERLS
jgi:hypothetical protein